MQVTIERTWLLQDRVLFPGQVGPLSVTDCTRILSLMMFYSLVLPPKTRFGLWAIYISVVFSTAPGKPKIAWRVSI